MAKVDSPQVPVAGRSCGGFSFAYNRDHSPEVDDVKGLAAAATEHLDLLKQKDKAKSSFFTERAVRKLQAEH